MHNSDTGGALYALHTSHATHQPLHVILNTHTPHKYHCVYSNMPYCGVPYTPRSAKGGSGDGGGGGGGGPAVFSNATHTCEALTPQKSWRATASFDPAASPYLHLWSNAQGSKYTETQGDTIAETEPHTEHTVQNEATNLHYTTTYQLTSTRHGAPSRIAINPSYTVVRQCIVPACATHPRMAF